VLACRPSSSTIPSGKTINRELLNLNIPRYVDTFEEEEPVDMGAVNAKIKRLRGELADVEAQMQAYLEELGLDENA